MLRTISKLALIATAGCSAETDAEALRPMIGGKHQHYHVHGVDIEHDHSHTDFQYGGHTHKHTHLAKSPAKEQP
jgi:hypothetical protein